MIRSIATSAAARVTAVLAVAVLATTASAARHVVDITPTRSMAAAGDRGLAERTREYELALARHEARTAVAAVNAAAELERVQVAIGTRPPPWARLKFPATQSGAVADASRGAARAVGDISAKLEESTRTLLAGADEADRAPPATSDAALVHARVARLRADVQTRVNDTRSELEEVARGVSDATGGFWARVRVYLRQLTWRDPATRVASIRARLASWGAVPRPPPIGSDLTYVSPAQTQRRELPSSDVSAAYLSSAWDAGAAGTLEDVSANSEVESSDELHTRAVELGSAAAAYEFVKNHCRYEWYYGALKGSTEVLRECAGNDVDLATLLIALLRAQGTPARYVHGTIELPLSHVASLAGLLDSEAAAADAAAIARLRDPTLRVVQAAGIPYEPVYSAGTVSAVRLAHVWVEAFVGYGEYRGARPGTGARQWVAMDPFIAGRARTFAKAPVVDVASELPIDAEAFAADYVQTVTTVAPLDVLRSKVTTFLAARAPGTTYADAQRTVQTAPEVLGFIPGSLPYRVIRVHGEHAFLPDSLRQRARIVVADSGGTLIDVTLPLHRFVAHRAALAFSPATDTDTAIIAEAGGFFEAPAALVQLTPSIRLEGNDVAVGTRPVGAGAPLRWSIELLLADGTRRTVENTTVAGNVVALGFGGPRNLHVDAPLFEEDDVDSEATRFLYARAAAYATEWTDGEDELARLLGVVLVRPTANLAFVESQIEVSEVLGIRQRLEFKGVEIDADFRNVAPVELVAGRARTFLRLSGLEGSHREARVLSDACQVAAISAVGVLQHAHQQGVPVLRVTPANVASELQRLAASPDLVEDVRDHVARGHEVTIPASVLTVEDWTGSGYVVVDPATGEGAYFLTGRVSGGKTIVSPHIWAPEMVASLTEQNSQPSTDKASAITAIAKVQTFDMSRVRVGTTSQVPLRVKVWAQWRDNGSRYSAPVRGVTVEFYRCDGVADELHPVCGSTDSSSPALGRDESELLGLLRGTADQVKASVHDVARRVTTAVTDAHGYASAWITPDPDTGNHGVLVGNASPGSVPQLMSYNKIMAVVWVQRTPGATRYPIVLREPFAVLGEPDAAAQIEAPLWTMAVEGVGGLELSSKLMARVVDRFGNQRANETIRWTSGTGGGRFVDPGMLQPPTGTTNGIGAAVLDRTGTDRSQVEVLHTSTLTLLPTAVGFIPGYGQGFDYRTSVTAVVQSTGLSRDYPVSVRNTHKYAFSVASMRDVWLGGIRGMRFASPFVATAFVNDPVNGWSPLTQGVTIEQETSARNDVTVRTETVPGAPSGRTTLWPRYEYADDWQQVQWSAVVKEDSGKTIPLDEVFYASAWSGIVKVSFERVDRFSLALSLPWASPARGSDQLLNIRITNPTEREIYVRPDEGAVNAFGWERARDIVIPANGIGGWGQYVQGDQEWTVGVPINKNAKSGTVTFQVIAPDFDPDGNPQFMRLLPQDGEVVFRGGLNSVSFAGPLECTYYIAEHEFSCRDTRPGTSATVIGPTTNVFSGNGQAENDPECVFAQSKGPLPPGDYTIGEAVMHPKTGPLSYRLDPLTATETCGRGGFYIHSGQLSEGCVVFQTTTVLQQLNDWGRGVLHVVSCKEGPCGEATCGDDPPASCSAP